MNIKELNTVPLDMVLSNVMSGMNNADGHANKWKIDNGSHIMVQGDKWYNLNRNEGGIGAVGLVTHWLDSQGTILDQKSKMAQTVAILTPLFNEFNQNDDVNKALSNIENMKKNVTREFNNKISPK